MRLFVGIALPAQAREALARLAGGIRGARWVASENLHLTLRFIGDVDADMAEDLDAALGVVRVPPFSLALSGVGVFERRGRVHAAWAGTAPQAAWRICGTGWSALPCGEVCRQKAVDSRPT